MERAIELAKLGGGWVNPNPQVGCVIVSDGQVIGEGYHHAFGKPHAEREALADCTARGNDPAGATVYVTLEPCAHHGKTPPCADALIEAGIGRVVVGSSDPNPLVVGKGLDSMREAGIEVDCGFLEAQCDAFNEPFFHHIRTGRPLVLAKYAMTMDGMFATKTGKSRWITDTAARRRVHEDRSRYAAIMVGLGTVIADDPMLNVRGADGQPDAEAHQPTRIVVDSRLRMPLDRKVVTTANQQRTIIVTCEEDVENQTPYLEAGCILMIVEPTPEGHADLVETVSALGEAGIDSIILEGGRRLLGSAFEAHIVDKVQAYIAPKIFANIDEPSDASYITDVTIDRLGPDILLQGNVD